MRDDRLLRPIEMKMRFPLFGLILLLCVCASAEEAEIATALRALGGEVTESGSVVTKVFFRDCSKLGDAEFRQIGQLKGLKNLTLYGNCKGLNDETLAHLSGLAALEELSTDAIQVSDDGLKQLTALQNLRSASFFHISFQKKGFTGAGFAHLKTMPKLERLTVAGTTFNDEGMAAIGQLTQLKEFSTWHTWQTQAGNAHLTKLVDLRSLTLGQRLRRYDGRPNPLSLDDTTLATLAQIRSLETLTLDEARLTHAGLASLKAMPKLKRLKLQRIDIAEADIEKLRADLQNVQIEWKPLTEDERKRLDDLLKP